MAYSLDHVSYEQSELFSGSSELPADEGVAGEFTPATFYSRASAFGLDKLIITIIMIMLGFCGYSVLELSGVSQTAGMWYETVILFSWLWFLVDGVYFTFFHGYLGQTIGKIVFGIKVVCDDGRPLGFGRAAGRWLGYFASDIILGIGYLMAAFTKYHQALHDKIADTKVIQINSGR